MAHARQKRIVLGVGGSSGSIYAKVMMDDLAGPLREQWDAVGVVMSDNARYNWELEIGDRSYRDYPFDFYTKRDFRAPFASGSARYDTVIVCPCSMGLLGRVAHGISDDLLTRACDVALKERRQLILCPRDKPYSLLHLRNMVALTEAGAIINGCNPSFYSNPEDFEGLARTVTNRVLDIAGFELEHIYRWGKEDLPELTP